MRIASSLSEFLRALERRGELRRVRAEVDPELEITEIASRQLARNGPALLFQRVRGSPYPLALNIFAGEKRLELALGRHPAQIGEEITRAVERLQPPSLGALWRSRSLLWRATKMRLEYTRRPPSQEIVEHPDLTRLPVLKCWPGDGGRFLTYPLVITAASGGHPRNVGLYRMQVFSATETGMHWQIQKGGGFHYHEAERSGRPLDVAVAIGADPILLFAAMCPLPEGLDELLMSGFLRGRPTRVAKGISVDLPVPAGAEFVLEGRVLPGERRLEGPFGDHYGHYSSAEEFPVFRLHKQTRRKDPVYLAAVVGKPPQEDMYLGNAVQEMFTPLLKLTRPEVRDLWSFYEGGFHTLLGVSMLSRYPKEGIKTALGLLGEGQLSLTKVVIVVGESVSPRSFRQLCSAIRENFKPSRDFLLLPGTAMDTLDFTGPSPNLGSKMVIDATGDLGACPPQGSIPSPLPDPGAEGHLPITGHVYLEDCMLVVKVAPHRESDAKLVLQVLLHRPWLSFLKVIVAVSDDVDLEDDVALLWGILTRFDPAQDVFFRDSLAVGAALVHEGPLGIDATFKAGYPEPLSMDEDIVARVDKRWGELFPGN